MIGRPINVNEDLMREEDEVTAGYVTSGAERGLILSLLGPTPVDLDDLIRESGLKAPIVIALVLELELAGLVKRHRRSRIALSET